MVGDLSPATFDLLDGSELEVVGPASLDLSSYFFFIEVPGLGSSNVYVVPGVEPAEAAAVEDAEFHSDLGNGVQLWMGDREGRPVFMTVEMGDWIARLHVGWETRPETDFLMSLADQLRGETSSQGVIIPDFGIQEFELSLGDSASENDVEVWIGVCHRERIPNSEVVETGERGQVIRTSGYASWCDLRNDLEVRVYGEELFVEWVVETLALTRNRRDASAADTTESPTTAALTAKPHDADSCAASFRLAISEDGTEVREPQGDESLMVSFQGAYEWNGEYPVCWAAYTSTTDGCWFFSLDIDGVYSDPHWSASGHDDPPCILSAYQEYPTPP